MAEVYVSKVSYDNGIVQNCLVYRDNTLEESVEWTRGNLFWALENNHVLVTIGKDERGNWIRIGRVSIVHTLRGRFLRSDSEFKSEDALGRLPRNLPCRKIFVSYYHKSDQQYKKLFLQLFEDIIIDKSIADGDINEGNSAEYTKTLIQKGYLSDTTVLIVLVSELTKCRKHIDWEISGALDHRVGDGYAGLIGLHLPNHCEFGVRTFNPNLQPGRLEDNAISGYGKIYDWTTDRSIIQARIEDAFDSRTSRGYLRKNDRLQMERNTGGD